MHAPLCFLLLLLLFFHKQVNTRVRHLYSFSSLSSGAIGCKPLDHLNQEVQIHHSKLQPY